MHLELEPKQHNIPLTCEWEGDIYQEWNFPVEVHEKWKELSGNQGDRGIFSSEEWLRIWWDAFGNNQELLIIVLKKGGEIKAIFPCYIKASPRNGKKARTISPLANAEVWHCDFLVAPQIQEEALPYFLTLLYRVAPGSDILFQTIRMPSQGVTSFVEELRLRWVPVFTYVKPWSPWMDLSCDWATFQQGLPSRLKNTIKKAYKKAEGKGKLHFTTITHSDQLDELLDTIFTIEYRSWKGKTGTAIKCHADVERYYRSLAHCSMRNDALFLSILRLDDVPISFYLCFSSGGTLFGIKTGYDESFGFLSPGNLLYSEMFKTLFNNRKFVTFDFLADCEPWKMEWTSNAAEYGWLRGYPGTLDGWRRYTVEHGWREVLRRYSLLRKLKSLID